MKKVKTATLYLMIFVFVAVFTTAKAESFDSEAVSQVSEGIAEWKLTDEDEAEIQGEQTVYVSSSLSGMVGRGNNEQITIVQGLTGFTSSDPFNMNYSWKQVEVFTFGRYAPSERTIYLEPLTWINFEYTDTYIGNKYLPSERTLNIQPSWGGISAGGVTYKDVYAGNKYLPSERTVNIGPSWGQVSYTDKYAGNRYTPAERIVKIGPSWAQIEWRDTFTGNKYVNVDRSIHFGHPRAQVAWTDQYSGTDNVTIITKSQQSYRIETVGGISKITLLPGPAFGNSYGGVESKWNSPPPTFNATWKTVKMGSTTFKYPSIDWSSISKTTWTISNTNPFPTYTPSPSRMPGYTPTAPSSSWGRKY